MGKQNLNAMLDQLTGLLDKSAEEKGIMRCAITMQMLQLIKAIREEIGKLEEPQAEAKE